MARQAAMPEALLQKWPLKAKLEFTTDHMDKVKVFEEGRGQTKP